MNELKHMITGDIITVLHEGESFEVKKGAPNFEGLRRALFDRDWEAALKNLTIRQAVDTWSKGLFKARGQRVVYNNDVELGPQLSAKILEDVGYGRAASRYMRFWERLFGCPEKNLPGNPSSRSVEQTYPFVAHRGIAIDEDGYLLTYKSIKEDFTDHHTGQVNNRVGAINEMPRNRISDDPNKGCHFGFHVGALGYAKNFHSQGSRIVICKVDPADVVCVPFDSSHQKMRVCRYEVVGYHGGELPGTYNHEEEGDEPSENDGYYDEYGNFVPYDEDEYESDEYESDEDEEDYDEEDEYESDEVEDEEDEDEVVSTPKRTFKKTGRPGFRDGARSTAPRGSGFAKYDRMDEAKLLKVGLGELRRYAAKGLLIYGASKIRGGKPALVTRIMQVRGAGD